MKSGKILKVEYKIFLECPECSDTHKLSLLRDELKENTFNVHCFGCSEDFKIDLKNEGFPRITE